MERIKELGEKNIEIKGVGPRKAIRKWEFDAEFRLRETSTIFEGPTDIDVSLADLMFLSVALDNKFAREHYLYGNLWSDDERAFYEPKGKDGRISAKVMEEIEAIGKDKELALRKAIDEYLKEDDGKGGKKYRSELINIAFAIQNDFDAHFHETKAVFETMFNRVVEAQDNYLPIVITEGQHADVEKQNEIEALTVGTHQVRVNPDKGMMMARVDIGPTHQTAIETDIFKVFFKGIEREEHFVKFAPYIRDINTVLRGRNNASKQLASYLDDIYGKWAVDRMYQHINLVGLPPSAKVGNAVENAGVAYIAYNLPSWLAQYPSSLAGFFGKADPGLLLGAVLEVMKPGNDLVERVYAKSPKVKHRVINVAEEYRKYLSEQKGAFKQIQAQFIEIGMKGQQHADRTMVAAGWWALYQTALKGGKSEEDARVYADEIVAETQPDLNALETSPMYKEEGARKLFLRFTQPLNVIWQNLTYDNIVSREKTFGSVVARVTAYGVAALIVAAMQGSLAKENDEKLEPDELIRKVFYYVLASPMADSVPYVGNMVSGTLERLITGDGQVYQSRFFELAERVLNVPLKLQKGNFEAAIKDAIHALSLGAGLPISQFNRIIKAIEEEDPWIIFGFDPK